MVGGTSPVLVMWSTTVFVLGRFFALYRICRTSSMVEVAVNSGCINEFKVKVSVQIAFSV